MAYNQWCGDKNYQKASKFLLRLTKIFCENLSLSTCYIELNDNKESIYHYSLVTQLKPKYTIHKVVGFSQVP